MANAAVAGFWFLPAMMIAASYYAYDTLDYELKPVDRKRLLKKYDFVISKFVFCYIKFCFKTIMQKLQVLKMLSFVY